MFEDLEAAGIRVVVRNSYGEILAALSKIIPLPSSIFVLETIAQPRVVTFLQEIGLSKPTPCQYSLQAYGNGKLKYYSSCNGHLCDMDRYMGMDASEFTFAFSYTVCDMS
ncbi:hypothetical protein CFP56_030862 [Quercus suber]|uniref:Uncharacterized protein n=1 Tax=Quercus suber TaxID=58331 RepID=A0AAW0JNR2_QUESU